MPVADKRITPCLLIGEGEKKKEVGGSLIELEVEEHHELASVFRIKLAIVREADGLWTFLDENSATPWSRIEIKMSVGDREEELMVGYVTDIRVHIDPVEGNSHLELVGMDTSCLMSAEEVIKDWPEMRDSAVAAKIFDKYQLDYEVEDTEVDRSKDETVTIQRESDIQFLKRLARRNGCECVIQGKKAIFARPDMHRLPLPELAAHFGAQTSLSSFDANINLLRPTTVECQQVDTASKEIQTITLRTSAQKRLGKDGPPVPPLKEGRPRVIVRHHVLSSTGEGIRLVDAIGDEAAWFVEARGEVESSLYGDILHVRRRVPIKGVGALLSGAYYLTSVRHHYNTDRYTQQFTARRNATTSLPDDFAAGSALPF